MHADRVKLPFFSICQEKEEELGSLLRREKDRGIGNMDAESLEEKRED